MITVVCAVLLCSIPVFADEEDEIGFSTKRLRNTTNRHGHELVSDINMGTVCIGHPPQCFDMILDTGSSDLWVDSTRCQGDLCQNLTKKYDHELSDTYSDEKDPPTANLSYGTGEMTIRFARERFTLGKIVVENQEFGESLSASEALINAGVGGILGLALENLSHNNMTPIFFTMFDQKKIKQNLFTFCKPRSNEKQGELILGKTGSKHYDSSDLVYTDLISKNYWKFNLTRMSVKGKDDEKDVIICDGCAAIVDTGTTVIRGSEEDVEKLNEAIGGWPYKDGIYQVNCSAVDSLPNIQFIIEDKTFEITPDYYVFSEANDVCITAISVSSADSDIGFWILGGTFLDGLCTVYDVGNSRLGFAKAKDDTFPDVPDKSS